ncbi:MAG: VanW family protein, partial [Armatimonadota bacterium]
ARDPSGGGAVSAWLGAGGAAVVLGGLAFALIGAPAPNQPEVVASYATPLKGRSSGQRHNAIRAAQAIDGVRVRPGETFSFNVRVGSWSRDAGYVRAPVSMDGTILLATGGGVCQTSTTLYNAALLAGLTVRERHPHVVAPAYVPPGRDAAVAWPGIDLRIRNPLPWPVTLRAKASGDRLVLEIVAPRRSADRWSLDSRVLSVDPPGRRRVAWNPRRRASPGRSGFRATAERVRIGADGTIARESLSDDRYVSMDAVVPLAGGGS